MQRSFLGEIRTLRPCAACRGFGTIIPDPCRECSGDGRVRSRRTLTVKIPAGVDTGTRVQLAEQGEVGPGGGPAGDLYVEIHVARARRPSPGTATTCTPRSRVPMTAAALGTTLTLPTLEADLVDAEGATTRASRPPSSSRSGPAPSPAPSRCSAAAACPGCAPAAATSSSRCWSRRRSGSTRARRSCCASWPRSATRRSPPVRSRRGAQGRVRPAARRVQRALSRADVPARPLGAVAGRRRAWARPSTVTGDEAHHAVAVRRLRVGRAGRAHRRARPRRPPARWPRTGKRRLSVSWSHRSSTLPPPEPEVVVVQALPKGDRGELAVEVLTEVGVARIVPWAASRWSRSGRASGPRSRWPVALHRARGRQAGAARVVPRGRRWPPPPTCGAGRRRRPRAWCCTRTAPRRWPPRVPAAGSVVVVVGPEGGLTDDEVARFAAAGAHAVRLGPQVLRTSTAGVAAVAALAVADPALGRVR